MSFNGNQYTSDEGYDLQNKGDIHGFSTANAAIPVGSNNQTILADSAQALGLKYAASSTSTLTTTGDLLAASAANVLTRIGAGASGEILTGNGAGVLPTFQAAAGGGAWEELANTSGTTVDELDSGTITAKDWLDVQVYVNNTAGSGNQNWQLNFNADQWDDGNSKYATQETQSYSFGTAGRTAQPTLYWGVGYTRADEFYGHTLIANFDGEMSIILPMDVTIGYGDATTAPFAQFMRGVWNDTAQITKVTASINPSYGTGDWYMRVLGSD